MSPVSRGYGPFQRTEKIENIEKTASEVFAHVQLATRRMAPRDGASRRVVSTGRHLNFFQLGMAKLPLRGRAGWSQLPVALSFTHVTA
jgi:hypothetical protein